MTSANTSTAPCGALAARIPVARVQDRQPASLHVRVRSTPEFGVA
jgi:hypothetical protein